jgi:tetratricopeptide (TPR) repeat protein
MRQVLLLTLMLLTAQPAMAAGDTMQQALLKSYDAEKAGLYDEAVTALLSQRKQSYLINMRLGWLHYLRQDYASSKQFYQAAMRMAPKAVEPRLGYTLPLMAELRWGEVETTCRSVLSLDASQYTAALRLTTALRWQAKYQAARTVNAGMLELYPNDVSFLAEQLVVSAVLKTSDVKALCETILLLDPTNATANAYLPTLAMLKR